MLFRITSITSALLAISAVSAMATSLKLDKRLDDVGTIQLRPDPAQGAGITFLRGDDTEPSSTLIFRTDGAGNLPVDTAFTVIFTPKGGVSTRAPCDIVGKMDFPNQREMAYAFANDDSFLHPCGSHHGTAITCEVVRSSCAQIGVYDFSVIDGGAQIG